MVGTHSQTAVPVGQYLVTGAIGVAGITHPPLRVDAASQPPLGPPQPARSWPARPGRPAATRPARGGAPTAWARGPHGPAGASAPSQPARSPESRLSCHLVHHGGNVAVHLLEVRARARVEEGTRRL